MPSPLKKFEPARKEIAKLNGTAAKNQWNAIRGDLKSSNTDFYNKKFEVLQRESDGDVTENSSLGKAITLLTCLVADGKDTKTKVAYKERVAKDFGLLEQSKKRTEFVQELLEGDKIQDGFLSVVGSSKEDLIINLATSSRDASLMAAIKGEEGGKNLVDPKVDILNQFRGLAGQILDATSLTGDSFNEEIKRYSRRLGETIAKKSDHSAQDLQKDLVALKNLLVKIEGLSELERQLLDALKKSSVTTLPSEYHEFCEKVYASGRIMESETPENVDDFIYSLYSKATLVLPTLATNDEFVAYWRAIHSVNSEAFLQSTGMKIKKIIATDDAAQSFTEYSRHFDPNVVEWVTFRDKVNTNWGKNFENWGKEFVYMYPTRGGVGGKAEYRVYANTKISDIARVASTVDGATGVRDYKFTGPASIGKRGDSLVVYCDNEDNARNLAQTLGQQYEFYDQIPGMLESSNPGIGIGKNPEEVTTGMRTERTSSIEYRNQLLEDARRGIRGARERFELELRQLGRQSFGTVRSEVIASAVEHWKDNKVRAKVLLGLDEKETFLRLVATGLKGFGLI